MQLFFIKINFRNFNSNLKNNTMIDVIVQFRIEKELVSAHDPIFEDSNIQHEIIHRLKNGSAKFDKMVEDDGDGDMTEQLYETVIINHRPTTFVDFKFSVEKSQLEEFENNADLVMMKSIAALQKDAKLANDIVKNRVAFLSFR